MKAIEIIGLKKEFVDKKNNTIVQAVKNVTLSVKKGEIFGFLGPNGAGKTTSIRMLTTLLPIGDGEVSIGPYDVRINPNEVRKHIGYVGQLGGSDIEATGRENLVLSGRLYGMTENDVQGEANFLILLLDLKEIIDRPAKTYSGGQKRRLEIAMGILHKPDVLFLDEPSTGLDPQNRANLWDHIRSLKNAGMTIFLTTHYLDEADQLCDRLCIMDKGEIVAEGTPKELKQDISGDVVSLKPRNLKQSIKSVFENDKEIVDIRLEGERTNLYIKNGAEALPRIFDKLKLNNVQVESITLSEPSLDDVFLKQTGRSLRDIGKEQ